MQQMTFKSLNTYNNSLPDERDLSSCCMFLMGN